MTDIHTLIETLHKRYATLNEGKVADYIPELAKAKSDWFSVVIATVDGEVFAVGDAEQAFTIQSMSKPFTYGLALEDHGRDTIFSRVAVEPVGKTFNAIVLEESTGRPPNPMMNSGAIAISDMIKGEQLTDKLNRLLGMFKTYTGHDVHMDVTVYTSERMSGFHNRAIANLLRASGAIKGDMDEALEFYFQQCSLQVNTLDLAIMAATFANRGINPKTGERAIPEKHVRDILSVMYTCGMYDSSGEWAYRVGVPAKSGVSGGIFGVVPNRMGIAVFSPLLNEQGHSVRGLKVFEDLSDELNLHIFAS
jgi:glutaminase